MDERLSVTDITVDRNRAVVEVVFGDGHQGRFGFAELRANCPCATCRGIRDQGGVAGPVGAAGRDLTVTDARLVGAWGLGLTWDDGHATGIFPWESLRRWSDDAGPAFGADSGRGA